MKLYSYKTRAAARTSVKLLKSVGVKNITTPTAKSANGKWVVGVNYDNSTPVVKLKRLKTFKNFKGRAVQTNNKTARKGLKLC